MHLVEVKDQKIWDGFVSTQPGAQFTQSWAWGDFRMNRGQVIKRYALVDGDGKWYAAALFIYFRKRILWGYWYAPRGPVFLHGKRPSVHGLLHAFCDALERKGLPQRALFWRCEPTIEIKQDAEPFPAPYVRAHAYMPASTFIIDLTKDEAELMSRMHEKTRYNVRLAERKGVIVRTAQSVKDVDAFIRMNEETAARDRYRSQPLEYIRATYEFLHPRRMATIRLAEFGGELLASSMEISYGDTVTYLYGGSSGQRRNVMAPYALHWDAIRAAKASGYRFYDFHGVNPEDESSPYYKESWNGITRFKLGWGGYRINYVGTWEFPRHQILYALARLISR